MKKILKLFIILFVILIVYTSTAFAGEWIQDGLEWKYKEGEEYLTNTWKLINSNNEYNNYYFNDKSHMVTGLYKIDNEIHAFTKDGVCLSNKNIRIDNIVYSTGNNGVVEDVDSRLLDLNYGGEWQVSNNKYQLICNGGPVTNEWRVIIADDKKGEKKDTKISNSYYYYYFDATGYMVSGLQQINGEYYLFDEDGRARGNESIYLYNNITTDTDAKGKLTYVPDDFSVEKYNKEIYAALHADELEQAALKKMNEEAAKNSGPKTITTPIGDETIKKDELQTAAIDSTYTMTLGEKGSAEITSEYGAKITINFQYPIVTGEKADIINSVIKSNLSKTIRDYFEDIFGSYSKRTVVNLNGVKFDQIYDSHLLRFTFRGGSRQVIIYVNTNTLEIYADN